MRPLTVWSCGVLPLMQLLTEVLEAQGAICDTFWPGKAG